MRSIRFKLSGFVESVYLYEKLANPYGDGSWTLTAWTLDGKLVVSVSGPDKDLSTPYTIKSGISWFPGDITIR